MGEHSASYVKGTAHCSWVLTFCDGLITLLIGSRLHCALAVDYTADLQLVGYKRSVVLVFLGLGWYYVTMVLEVGVCSGMYGLFGFWLHDPRPFTEALRSWVGGNMCVQLVSLDTTCVCS